MPAISDGIIYMSSIDRKKSIPYGRYDYFIYTRYFHPSHENQIATYLPNYNQRIKIPPKNTETAFLGEKYYLKTVATEFSLELG